MPPAGERSEGHGRATWARKRAGLSPRAAEGSTRDRVQGRAHAPAQRDVLEELHVGRPGLSNSRTLLSQTGMRALVRL